MILLGNYQSNLTAFLYDQLLAQLEASISSGEYAAGSLFDTAAAQAIQTQAQNFSQITEPSAGNTAYAQDFDNPVDQLQACYTAILNEIASVQQTIPQLLSVATKEAGLLDKTLAAATGELWGSQQPYLPTAQVFQWNFEVGHGATSIIYPSVGLPVSTYQTDPSNGVVYAIPVPDTSLIINETLGGDGTLIQGIGAPSITRTIPISSVTWNFTPASIQTQFEEIYGDDQSWAYLSTLEPNPILSFGPPNINVILPIGGSATGLFTASGNVPGGVLPVYVRILFYPRQRTLEVINATSNEVIQLSPYNITANTIQVYTSTKVYTLGLDYNVGITSNLTILPDGGLVGLNFTILFEEYYPAYQCSIDQMNWSPIFMLDPNRPYPDDTTDFIPIDIENGNFPLTDELGVPLGLYLQIIGVPTAEMELQVITPGSSVYGETAQLTIALERAVYMNGLQLAPFTNFPTLLQNIVAYGFTSNIQTTVLDIPITLDQEAIITFPRQLVRQFVLTFYQQNYELKEYIVQPPDALRRNTLANLQATLPFSVQTPVPAIPQFLQGAFYEFGVQNIQGIDFQPNTPGVFVSGPYIVEGMPEVIRLDAQLSNMPQTPTPSIYLAYIAYNGNDEILDQYEYSFTPGTSIAYASIQTGIYTADHVAFYVKLVFREALSVAQQIQLQVTVV